MSKETVKLVVDVSELPNPLEYGSWVVYLEERLRQAGFDMNGIITRRDDPEDFGKAIYTQNKP